MTLVWIALVIYALLGLCAYVCKRANKPEKLERRLREVCQEIAQTYKDNEISEASRAADPEFARRHIMNVQIAKVRELEEERRRLLLKLGRPPY